MKLYGLQRSGTNYLKWILEQNFHIRVLQNYQGWKHGEVIHLKKGERHEPDLPVSDLTEKQKSEIDNIHIPRIAIKKNIYAWLTSYHRYKTFNWFTDYKYLIDLYIKMNIHYEQFCYMIDYEQLLSYPVKILTNIQFKFKLTKRRINLILESDSQMPRGGDDHSDSWEGKYYFGKFDKNYYLYKRYINKIPNFEEIKSYYEALLS